jgi:C_GCAxxG_C_C family probable redox protein
MNNLIKKYYLEKGFNCAETMLLTANDQFNLQLNESHIRILSGFGGGMCKEKVCGVVTGGVAVLSVIFTDKDLLKKLVIEFQEKTENEFFSNDCKAIKPILRDDSNKCANVIDKAYKILENLILINK